MVDHSASKSQGPNFDSSTFLIRVYFGGAGTLCVGFPRVEPSTAKADCRLVETSNCECLVTCAFLPCQNEDCAFSLSAYPAQSAEGALARAIHLGRFASVPEGCPCCSALGRSARFLFSSSFLLLQCWLCPATPKRKPLKLPA